MVDQNPSARNDPVYFLLVALLPCYTPFCSSDGGDGVHVDGGGNGDSGGGGSGGRCNCDVHGTVREC